MGGLPALPVKAHDCELNWEYLQTRVLSAPVTSLPRDDLFIGRRIVYAADPTHGIYHDFVYTGVAPYPWAYVGGPPMRDIVPGSGVCTSANGYTSALTDFADVGITCALAGVYNAVTNVGISFTNTAFNYCEAGPQVNGATVGSADMGSMQSPQASNGSGITRHSELTVAVAGTKILTYYHTSDAVSGTFQKRKLEVTPVMVG